MMGRKAQQMCHKTSFTYFWCQRKTTQRSIIAGMHPQPWHTWKQCYGFFDWVHKMLDNKPNWACSNRCWFWFAWCCFKGCLQFWMRTIMCRLAAEDKGHVRTNSTSTWLENTAHSLPLCPKPTILAWEERSTQRNGLISRISKATILLHTDMATKPTELRGTKSRLNVRKVWPTSLKAKEIWRIRYEERRKGSEMKRRSTE